MREAGTVQVFDSLSTSAQVASRTSPERPAVSTKYSKASFTDLPALD